MHILLEAAQKAEKSLPKSVEHPWFLAELKATVEVIRQWYDKPVWKQIEPSLVDPRHFTHTIAKLRLASHLQNLGHSVKIIPKDKIASPDLKVRIFHTKEYFSIECYQPKKFSGESRVYPRELKKIVDHSMEKAKRQLEEKAPGILAICGFNQPKRIVEVLKQTIAKRLQLTERENLCGILTVFFGTLYSQDKNKRRFTPIISIDFVANRSYFGRLTIGENEHPKSIGPLEDISPEYAVPLMTKKPSRTRATIPTPITRKVKGIRLKLIKKPAHMSRAVIHAKESLPLFRGEGNNNYLCGQCGVILAEHAWKFSLSNIVVECPCCQSFNEFPKLKKKIELPIFGSVALARGEYYFKNALMLTRGACLFGL